MLQDHLGQVFNFSMTLCFEVLALIGSTRATNNAVDALAVRVIVAKCCHIGTDNLQTSTGAGSLPAREPDGN